MNEIQQTRSNLPKWLTEALAQSEPPGDLPNKRTESRPAWTLICQLTSLDDPQKSPVTVRVFNVTPHGIGFITRKELFTGVRFLLKPEGCGLGEPVRVRIIHCTQTVQGYKVGCTIESR